MLGSIIQHAILADADGSEIDHQFGSWWIWVHLGCVSIWLQLNCTITPLGGHTIKVTESQESVVSVYLPKLSSAKCSFQHLCSRAEQSRAEQSSPALSSTQLLFFVSTFAFSVIHHIFIGPHSLGTSQPRSSHRSLAAARRIRILTARCV